MKMKNWLAGLLVLAMLATMAMPALAADMGVQIIGGPEEEETEPVSMDDIKIGTAIVLEDDCEITPMSCSWADKVSYNNGWDSWRSGDEAEYLVLYIDILNTRVTPARFLGEFEVKAIFKDKYEYAGWAYQCNSSGGYAIKDESDWFAIDPMYKGYYVFGCALPNSIVESTDPLRLEIKFGDYEMTYNVRE